MQLAEIYEIHMDESRPRGGFILAETLVQNGTAGGNGTTGLKPASTRVSDRMKPPLGGDSSGNTHLLPAESRAALEADTRQNLPRRHCNGGIAGGLSYQKPLYIMPPYYGFW